MSAFATPAATPTAVPAFVGGQVLPSCGEPPPVAPASPAAPMTALAAASAVGGGVSASSLLGDLASLDGANAVAAAALPANPPPGSMGALPAGWHVSMHPTYNRPYYYNAVTKQSQWTFPTSAAAVPLPQLPQLNQPTTHSPGAMRRAFKELDGGVGHLAATLNLATTPAPVHAPVHAPSHAPPSSADEIL